MSKDSDAEEGPTPVEPESDTPERREMGESPGDGEDLGVSSEQLLEPVFAKGRVPQRHTLQPFRGLITVREDKRRRPTLTNRIAHGLRGGKQKTEAERGGERQSAFYIHASAPPCLHA